MFGSAEESLQEAGAALRHAVDVLRRRPADDVAAKYLVAEFHELRTVMSTAAILMKAFELSRFAVLAHQQQSSGLAVMLDEADADLLAGSDHLNSAAVCLTSARQRLDVPR
ncbi:hypothetical protein [Kribbella jiaozuonensis]|uniref:Uncharacterized protein n=1 Tax=Kribbella jiaozuonensis TaxID=2575441 RepID=A0A4U3M4U6_9ACTN|nr:hypothetical protein [Kribbella jiaozuonensis]TKK82386.1 hypothetical protein FDA38_06250 [Kribbella jiaozuonensis]